MLKIVIATTNMSSRIGMVIESSSVVVFMFRLLCWVQGFLS